MVSDPSWEDLERLLSGQPKGRVDEAITQVALSKQLALSGLSAFPEYLVSARTGELTQAPDHIRREMNDLLTEGYRVVFDSSDRRSPSKGFETSSRVVLLASAPPDLINLLNGPTTISEVISVLSKQDPSVWRRASGEYSAEVSTPIGFSFRLEVEPHNTGLKQTAGATA